METINSSLPEHSQQPKTDIHRYRHVQIHSNRCGTQFTAQEFKDFTQAWNIEHSVTSPMNAQSNGQAERFVQTIKNNLMKAMEEGEDPT